MSRSPITETPLGHMIQQQLMSSIYSITHSKQFYITADNTGNIDKTYNICSNNCVNDDKRKMLID